MRIQPRPPQEGQGSSSASGSMLNRSMEDVGAALRGRPVAKKKGRPHRGAPTKTSWKAALPHLAERPAVEPHQGVLALGVGAALLGLAPKELEQTVHLALHLLHLLAHVEDHLDAREVDPQVARQGEDDLQAADRLLIIETGVAGAAGGLDEAFPLVEPQRLRMDAVALRHDADHHELLVGLASRGHQVCSSAISTWTPPGFRFGMWTRRTPAS